MSIKDKTISGLFWAFFEQIGNKIVQFIIGIILARLLLPSEFGLLGMIAIFIAVANSISAGGFVQALIRKKECSEDDYNTSFIYNFTIAILLYTILFFASPSISAFYNEGILVWLIRILAIQIIIDSFSFVQRAILLKKLDFRMLAKASIIAQIVGGCVGIVMAISGFGVWSLVVKIITSRFVVSVYLIINNKWVPFLRFSVTSFKELFGFGSKMLVTSIIERAYLNIYNVVIGKYFSAASLGYYTRANQFKTLVSEQLVATIQRVSVPVLANLQDQEERLRNSFRSLVNLTFFLSLISLVFLIPTAKSMILFLIGDKWFKSILYLQLLASSAILYPTSQINLNVLQIMGRSDLILKLQIIKKVITIPFVVVGVLLGIKYLIIGIIIISISDYFISSYYSKKYIHYSSLEQLSHYFPLIAIVTIVALSTMGIAFLLNGVDHGLIFLIQVIVYFGMNIIIFEKLQKSEYIEIKKILINVFYKLKRK